LAPVSCYSVSVAWGRVTMRDGVILDADTPEAEAEARRRLSHRVVVQSTSDGLEYVHILRPGEPDHERSALTRGGAIVTEHIQ